MLMTGGGGRARADSVRVAIVDDEPLMRITLQRFFDTTPDIEVVGTCAGQEAVPFLAHHRPDVALLDIQMLGADGMTVLRQIQSLKDSPKVIVLTKSCQEEYFSDALFLGAAGYLLKDSDPEQLAQDIRSLKAGRRPLAPDVASAIITGYLDRCRVDEAAELVARLSPRERYALSLLGCGLTNTQIARRMGIAASTAKDHVSALLTKLGNVTRVQAAVIADRAGIIHWPSDIEAHHESIASHGYLPTPSTARLAYV
ncbi:putative two-component response regulator [Streptomyces sp. NBRC 110611]|uniref:response regulator n=1 Tax=Streptomyces sp. NBRC 110611 TaxID=1621259 RepID=UPI00083603ED|nr:response regulator transcription factor [Streptomyces sp. NBRC 110611]GAU67999.1 putative two-component response regulator [Streptomyces sp. NBRC 110611]